jgi:hypothetical protein
MVACDNYDGFQHLNFTFSKKLILIFRGLFNVETDPKVKVNSKGLGHEQGFCFVFPFLSRTLMSKKLANISKTLAKLVKFTLEKNISPKIFPQKYFSNFLIKKMTNFVGIKSLVMRMKLLLVKFCKQDFSSCILALEFGDLHPLPTWKLTVDQ